MSEKTAEPDENQAQISDIILVLDKEKKKIQALKNIDENGRMQTINPTKRNEGQFMRVDKHGDFFSNFFSNFLSQLKNPTNFSFFRVPEATALDTAKQIQNQINNPTPEGEKLLSQYEIKQKVENDVKQETAMHSTTEPGQPSKSETRFTIDQIDWDTMNNLGLTKERLEKIDVLGPLLKGYKTNELVTVSLNLGSVITKMDARLSLQPGPDNKAIVTIHGIRKVPNLSFEFFGHKFTDEDKKNLFETGNMGRIVNLINPKTDERIPSIISVDRMTNELVALRTEHIKIPDEIKGVKLNDEQKKTLMEGRMLHLQNMISRKGDPFSANVQFNADKRYVEFLFNKNMEQTHNKELNLTKEAPRTFRGKELNDEQYSKFKEGQTIYLDDLIDKRGQKYQGYITLNSTTNAISFSFKNPNNIEHAIPDEAHKTQVAVNSNGKTNEATDHVNEPLQQRQQRPKDKNQQELQNHDKKQVKYKSRKVQ